MGGGIGSLVGGLASSMLGNVAGKALEGIGGKLLGGLGDVAGSLISKFGGSNVAGAMTNSVIGSLSGSLTDVINNSPLPSFLKKATTEFISNFAINNQQPTTPDCQHAVGDEYGDMMDNISQGIAKEAGDEADEKTEGGGANWLVALAGSLAKMQIKFLDAAMENMETMKNNASAAVSGGDDTSQPKEAGEVGQTNEGGQAPQTDEEKQDAKDAQRNIFIDAQSKYQANMQMFNMMANMTATSIKSLGEGLTSLARKQ